LRAEDLARWAGERAETPLRLAEKLAPELEAAGLTPLYREVELKLVPVLAAMEVAGVKVDTAFLAAMSLRFGSEIAGIEQQVYAMAGGEFNLASPKQLGEVLFDKMQLPAGKKTRVSKVWSTDTEVLEELAVSYDIARLILQHRELTKLKGTYIDALPALVNPLTGRVHPSFNQTVAATGRLSCSDPNLQNIPIRTELGIEIRRAFVAEPGALLIAADYSQIELRLVAHLSGDPGLKEAFARGVAPAEVSSELRRRAKAINFGIIYGMSAFGLSRQLQITPAEAQTLIDQYFERYRGVRAWLDLTLRQARADGRVTTILGRLRHLPEINASLKPTREAAERTATNTPIQGAAADLIKLAMIRIERRLRDERLKTRMILQVHDELVFEAPENEAAAVTALVEAEMAGVHPLEVPLVVDIGKGRNWKEAKA